MRFSRFQIGLLVPIFAACASQTSREPVGTAASAINPEGSINSVSYTFAIQSIGVVNTWNPGNPTYVEYAALGASTQPFGTGTKAKLTAPVEGCSLGAVPAGYDFPGSTAPDVTLTTCKSATTTGSAPAGSPLPLALQQTVTLYQETDIANIAVVLDNAGSTSVTQLANAGEGADLSLAGSALSTTGTIVGVVTGIPTLGAGAVAGAVVSKIGSALSEIGSLLGTTAPVTTCGGGLISNGPDPNGVPTTQPADTLYLSYTAAQLEALTNATGTGSATVTIPVSINWPQALEGDIAYQCDSSHQINLTITRLPNSGPAADPLSGSIAVARTPNEIDVMSGDPGYHGVADLQWTPSSWTPYTVTPSNLSPGNYTPMATLSRPVLPAGTALTLVSASGLATAPTTALQGSVDSFWFDASGTLQWTEWLPGPGWQNVSSIGGGVPSGRLTATSRTPSVMDVFWVDAKGALNQRTLPNAIPGTASPGVSTVLQSGLAPAGAGLAAVSRFYNSEDVFFIGDNGGLYDASYTLQSVPGEGWTINAIGPSGIAPAGAYVTAVARDANSIDVFFIGSNDDVYWTRYFATATSGGLFNWVAPVAIPGATGTAGGPITAVSRTQATIDLVYSNGYYLDWTEFNPSGTSNWSPPSKVPTPTSVATWTDLSLVSPDTQDMALAYRDVFYGPHEGTWSQTSGAWTFAAPALPLWTNGQGGDYFTANASTISVAQNSGAGVNLTWSGPWVSADAGANNTFTVTSNLPAGAATIGGITAAAADLQLAIPLSTSVGTYTVTVVATDKASGVSHPVTVTVDVTSCAPVTCGTNACGTVATSNGCGGGPVVCGSCASGLVCAPGNGCCPAGMDWNAADGACVCPANEIWSQPRQECIANCTTLACKCVASGGTFNGKTCD